MIVSARNFPVVVSEYMKMGKKKKAKVKKASEFKTALVRLGN